jgi:hypothetical protein
VKIKQLGIVSGVALATLVTSGAAQAALVVVPSGLNPGDQYRLVFVTDGTRNAANTNINDFNSFVTNEANKPALNLALTTAGFNPGTITWNAIASTATVAARDNTGTNPSSGTGVPIYLIDGNRVANNNADLWDGSIQTQINRTASDQGGISSDVWTGSNTDGSIGTNLGGGFTGSGQTGNSTATDGSWIASSFAGLGPDSLRLYGISSVLTVPTPAVTVPEPSSLLGLITLGGLMLGSAVRLTGGGSDT